MAGKKKAEDRAADLKAELKDTKKELAELQKGVIEKEKVAEHAQKMVKSARRTREKQTQKVARARRGYNRYIGKAKAKFTGTPMKYFGKSSQEARRKTDRLHQVHYLRVLSVLLPSSSQ